MSSKRTPSDVRRMLAWIVMQLVNDSQSVRVELVAVDAASYTLQLTVSDKDMGRVIGPQGRIARSLRTVVRAIGVPDGIAYTLNITGSGNAARTAADHETVTA